MTPTKPPILQRWGIGLRAFPVYYLAKIVYSVSLTRY